MDTQLQKRNSVRSPTVYGRTQGVATVSRMKSGNRPDCNCVPMTVPRLADRMNDSDEFVDAPDAPRGPFAGH
jgi:hypothetical protein